MATSTTTTTSTASTTTVAAPPLLPFRSGASHVSSYLHQMTPNPTQTIMHQPQEKKTIVTIRVVQKGSSEMLLPAALPPVVAQSMGKRKPVPTSSSSHSAMPLKKRKAIPAQMALPPPPPRPFGLPSQPAFCLPSWKFSKAAEATKEPTKAAAETQPDSRPPARPSSRKSKETSKDGPQAAKTNRTRDGKPRARQSKPRPCSFEAGHVKMRVVPPKRKKVQSKRA